MKLFILISFFISFNSFSQVIEFGKDGTFSNNWHEGVLVLNNGDQKEGIIKFETAASKMYGMRMIGKIKYKANEKSKKKKYKGKNIDYFIVKNNSGDFEKYSYERISKNYLVLLRVLAEGRINLYSEDVYNSIPGFNGGYPSSKMYIKKDGETYVEYKNFRNIFKSFKTTSADYFSDCPSVMEKIYNEIYKSNDIIKIVKAYNTCF